MAQSDRDRYSTLEVWNVDPQDKISVPGNRTATPLTPDDRLGPGYTEDPAADAIGRKRRRCGLSPKVFWAAVVILILVILGAIAGGVAGGLANQKSESKSESSFEDQTAPNDETPSSSQMSAVRHHNDTHDIDNFRAVFYHKNGSIYMRWKDNRRSPSWTEENIESQFSVPDGEAGTLDVAKKSPLTAVVVDSDRGGRLRLFYITTGQYIREIQREITDSKWSPGIMGESFREATGAISGLAAIGHYCSSPRCGNETLLVFHKDPASIHYTWANGNFKSRKIISGQHATSLALFQAPSVNSTKMTEARLYYQTGETLDELVFNEDGDFLWSYGRQGVIRGLPTSEEFPIFSATPYRTDSQGLLLALSPSRGELTASRLPQAGVWNDEIDNQHQNLAAVFRNTDATETDESPENISGIALDDASSFYTRSGNDSKIRRYTWARESANVFTFVELVGG